MSKSVKIDGVRYAVGDIVWWRNCYGQEFRGPVVRVLSPDETQSGKPFIIIKRPDWFAEECYDGSNWIVSRVFTKREQSERHEITGELPGDQAMNEAMF